MQHEERYHHSGSAEKKERRRPTEAVTDIATESERGERTHGESERVKGKPLGPSGLRHVIRDKRMRRRGKRRFAEGNTNAAEPECHKILGQAAKSGESAPDHTSPTADHYPIFRIPQHCDPNG